MIHTGLPFFNPLLGAMPFPCWGALQQTSPPSSPPSSPITNTGLWQRNSVRGLSSFTIDSILGSKTQEATAIGPVRNSHRRDDRLSKSAPYSTELRGPSPASGIATTNCIKTKSKRVRTIFTAEQLERLEAEFSRQQYMVGPERSWLARNLNLTEAQVKVWFQNRRIKWRKNYMEQQHARLSNSPEEAQSVEETDSTPSPPSPQSTEVTPSSRLATSIENMQRRETLLNSESENSFPSSLSTCPTFSDILAQKLSNFSPAESSQTTTIKQELNLPDLLPIQEEEEP